MTDPRGDQGFAVAPQRLGAGRSGGGGPRRLAVLAVVVAAIGLVGAAWAGPRLGQRPNLDLGYLATPVPRTTPAPGVTTSPRPGSTIPGPTPLPTLTRPDGVTLEGHIAFVSDALRILDLATGATVEGPPVSRGLDALFPSAEGDGWTCICFVGDGGVEQQPSLGMTISRIDETGAQTTVDAGSGPTSPSDIRIGPGQSMDLDLSADRRRALIVTSTQATPRSGWTFAIRTIDATRGRVGATHELGQLEMPRVPVPSGSPSGQATSLPIEEAAYLDGPNIRMAPSGRLAYVWATVQRYGPDGVSLSTERVAWRLKLNDHGAIVEITDAAAFQELTGSCGSLGFLSDEQVVWACQSYGTNPAVPDSATLSVRVLDGDGRIVTSADLPNTGGFDGPPLIDRANAMLYYWAPVPRTLARIDLATLEVVVTSFVTEFRATAGVTTGGTRTPDWHVADSILGRSTFHQLMGEPDGSRLLLIASESTMGDLAAQQSLGVFVVDAGTLALVDRWAPAANYVLLANPRPGLVAAIGQPGIDAAGRPAPWLGTITIHDSATGAILGRYAAFTEETGAFIIEPGGP